MNCCKLREDRLVRQLLLDRLGDPEVDHLRHRHAVVQRDEDVRGLDVAVDDPLLMRVLDGLADLDEQVEAILCGELVLVAVLGDRNPADQFHHEVRPAGLGRAGIEHLGDVRMVHQRQRLPLGLEAGDDLLGVHAQLDDLEGHAPPDRLALLGHPDHAEAAFAELLEKLVAADDRAEFFRKRLVKRRWMELISSCPHEAAGFVMRIKQRLDASAKLVVGTGLQQEGFPFRWIGSGNRLVEEAPFNFGNFLHGGGSVLVEGLVIPPSALRPSLLLMRS